MQINAGHEVMMMHCWLGEVNFDYPFETMGTLPKAIAVQINGNDHVRGGGRSEGGGAARWM